MSFKLQNNTVGWKLLLLQFWNFVKIQHIKGKDHASLVHRQVDSH